MTLGDMEFWQACCGVIVLAAPTALVITLGVTSLLDRKLSERTAATGVMGTCFIGVLGMICLLAMMLTNDQRHIVIGPWNWVSVGGHDGEEAHYHFVIKFVFDRLSVPFVLLSFVLCGVIGAFANRYMHREPGYNRFFSLYSIFLLGMVVTGAAGTIETLFAGWELVGLSSALLIAFFHDRPAPVRNGLWVWIIYRIADAALLLAAVVLHHLSSGGDFDLLTGYRELPNVEPIDLPSWPFGSAMVTTSQSYIVGGLVLFAAAGKSALIPFSGWLPRAMEGPTPSSAVFYGALSVHLGAFLLLRISPVLDESAILSVTVFVLGLSTAIFAAIAGRVQTDIKSALSFASLTQVGLIVAEIGLGWRYIPLIHLLGHACLRTLQFVRAPSFLQDRRSLENAIGVRLSVGKTTGSGFLRWIYRFAMERGYLDAILADYIIKPFVSLFRKIDRFERGITRVLAGDSANKGNS